MTTVLQWAEGVLQRKLDDHERVGYFRDAHWWLNGHEIDRLSNECTGMLNVLHPEDVRIVLEEISFGEKPLAKDVVKDLLSYCTPQNVEDLLSAVQKHPFGSDIWRAVTCLTDEALDCAKELEQNFSNVQPNTVFWGIEDVRLYQRLLNMPLK